MAAPHFRWNRPLLHDPIVHDDPNQPTGTRIELSFAHGVPDLTGMQVEELIKPLVDFSVKTPLEAFTDTLPPFLKAAVKAHHVLVGMDRRMVLSTLGEPRTEDEGHGKRQDAGYMDLSASRLIRRNLSGSTATAWSGWRSHR